MVINIILIILLTIFGAIGSFFLKKVSAKASSLLNILTQASLYVGAFFYLISMLIYITIFKYIPYSIALPMTSLTYVWSLMLAYFLLKEKVNKFKIFGVSLIILGTFFVSLGLNRI